MISAPKQEKHPTIAAVSHPVHKRGSNTIVRRVTARAVNRFERKLPKSLTLRHSRTVAQFHWADSIAESDWQIYRAAIEALRAAGIPFLLGGGFALATFIGRWRDTKDIDFYIRPKARRAAIA